MPPKIGLMDLIQFVDPFKWFRRNKGMFPQISLLATNVLCGTGCHDGNTIIKLAMKKMIRR